MSVYFPHGHTGYADHHVEKAFRSIEKFTESKKHIQTVAGDFNAELGLGIGIERLSVGPCTLKESNKRGDWMKQWMVMQKTGKQATYRTPKGAGKQLD